MKVCHDHTKDTKEHTMKIALDCPNECTLITGGEFEGEPNLIEGQNGKLDLKVDNKVFDNFCLGYECLDGAWVPTYEACHCKSLTDFQSDLTELQKAYPGVDLCCSKSGILNTEDQTCYQDDKIIDPDKTDSNGTYQCSWKTRKEFEHVTRDDLKNEGRTPTCLSIIKTSKGLSVGGIICTPACQGKEKCFQSCNLKNKCFNGDGGTLYKPCEESTDWSDIMGFPMSSDEGTGNIEYGYGEVPCHKIHSHYDSQQIFPEDKCQDQAHFNQNGDLVLRERNITLHYKEFCVTPTTKDHRKGRIMIQACLPKKEEKTKFSFYFIILSISITCLILTILVYVIFHKALLKTSYNKIMLNFATSLFLAFLILVINMNHSNDFSKLCCTILGHFNQFFFLATFTWMTIMSYEIFKQIHGMNHFIGGHNANSILKQILVGYGVPFLIVRGTIIVEVSAPPCASYNPKFGHKSCLFFGKLDKFLWLYGPILIMLLINTGMFIYITINVVKNQ